MLPMDCLLSEDEVKRMHVRIETCESGGRRYCSSYKCEYSLS